MSNVRSSVLLYSPSSSRRKQAERVLREHLSNTEIWGVASFAECRELLGHYFNALIYDGIGKTENTIAQECHKLRYLYQGRLILISRSRKVDPDEWGWKAKVTACKRSIEEVAQLLVHKLGQPAKRGKLAIVCSGGGIPGAFYEIGCLKYLSEMGVVNRFDIYVGTSCGAYILSLLVNRITLENLQRDQQLSFYHFFQPNLEEYQQKFKQCLRYPKSMLQAVLQAPWRLFTQSFGCPQDNLDPIFRCSSLFPSALLDTGKIRQSLEEIIEFYGGTNSFDEVRQQGRELYITAVDLDTSESKIMGENGTKITISEAVEASIAIPGIYKSKILEGHYYTDGAIKNNSDLDTAIAKGADMIIVLHPLVPYMGGTPGFIYKLGPMALFEQSYRTLLSKALQDSIDIHKYKSPHVTVLTIHPDPKDPSNFTQLLNASPALQKRNMQKGYQDTERIMKRNADFFTRVFHKHGHDVHIV